MSRKISRRGHQILDPDRKKDMLDKINRKRILDPSIIQQVMDDELNIYSNGTIRTKRGTPVKGVPQGNRKFSMELVREWFDLANGDMYDVYHKLMSMVFQDYDDQLALAALKVWVTMTLGTPVQRPLLPEEKISNQWQEPKWADAEPMEVIMGELERLAKNMDDYGPGGTKGIGSGKLIVNSLSDALSDDEKERIKLLKKEMKERL